LPQDMAIIIILNSFVQVIINFYVRGGMKMPERNNYQSDFYYGLQKEA